jgi:hypothetical protein
MVANRFLGNPTDRDDTGGLWKRGLGLELRSHLAIERAGLVILHLRVRAPQFYPNYLGRGSGDRPLYHLTLF